MSRVEAVLSALAYTFCARAAGEQPELGAPYNDAARFLAAELAAAPDFLRPGLRGLTLLFDWSSLPRTGARFHRLPQAERLRRVEAWRGSALAPFRDLMRLWESLSLYALYARVDGRRP